MEALYNVKYKFKGTDNVQKNDFKKIFNLKLLNVIMNLESEKPLLNNFDNK